MTSYANFATPPPRSSYYELSVPAPFVLVITIARERYMNSIPMDGHWLGDSLFKWFDQEPTLRVAIVTGKGKKSFCAGADLLEQHRKKESEKGKQKKGSEEDDAAAKAAVGVLPPSGFMGLTKRIGKKPVIAAVNGFALGGGFEIALNCDLVVASPTATFGLPEAKRGIYAGAGGLPRVVRIFGMQAAAEIALTGRNLTAAELEKRGFLKVAASPDTLMDEALKLAADIGDMSPDAVVVTRAGLREAWETASVQRSAQLTDERYHAALMSSENTRIGLEAFAKKQKPNWVASKL